MCKFMELLNIEQLKKQINTNKRHEIERNGGVVFCVSDAITKELEAAIEKCNKEINDSKATEEQCIRIGNTITEAVDIALENGAKYGLKIGAITARNMKI